MSSESLAQKAAREVRAELGRQRRSASWLAREAGMGQTAVSRRLTGEVPMDLNDMETFARVLDVPITIFLPVDVVPRRHSDGGGKTAGSCTPAFGVSPRRRASDLINAFFNPERAPIGAAA